MLYKDRKWMGENQKKYTGWCKGEACLCKKGNISIIAYCRDKQPDRIKKKGKEQTKR